MVRRCMVTSQTAADGASPSAGAAAGLSARAPGKRSAPGQFRQARTTRWMRRGVQ